MAADGNLQRWAAIPLMSLCRRFVLLLCIAFWQGGFMFYGGVVVPIGGRILGSETEQGFITQSVTNYLNLAGACCLFAWGVVLWLDAERSSWCRWASWGLWLCCVFSLGVLAGLHAFMDRSLNIDAHTILHRTQFHWLHRAYIATSTAQWLASLALVGCTLRIWQAADERRNG